MTFKTIKTTNNIRRSFLFSLFLWFGLCFGCAGLLEKKPAEEKVVYFEKWDLPSYALFLKQNMKDINEKYSTDYTPYDFVVDTETGSTVIQNLIEPQFVFPIVDSLKMKNLEDKDKILYIYDYVFKAYDYILDAYHWPTVEETVRTKKGDCKGLSLLLMSLWIAAGFDTHAAISNNHMWVNVFYDNSWHVFELDKDPDRNKIYSIPGFYDHPLFKIYKDRTYKRKARNYKDPVNNK